MLVSHQSLGQNADLINRFKSPSPSKEPLWQSWNVIIFPIIPPPGYVTVATHNTANVVFPPDIVRCGGDVDQAASVATMSCVIWAALPVQNLFGKCCRIFFANLCISIVCL